MEEFTEEDPQLSQKLTDAIRDQNFHNFKQLTKNYTSREWRRQINRDGWTVLHEAILENSKEIFDYILLSQDPLDLETVDNRGETALMFVLNDAWHESREYYACELIKKGAFIHTICTYNECECDSFLHQAVYHSSIKVTKLLLEKGIDVDLQDNNEHTGLLKVLDYGPHNDAYEFVAALLYYGSDPFIESYGYNAFELSVVNDQIFPIQETLFFYTFDKYTHYEIYLVVLLQLAIDKSPLFHKIFEYDIAVVSRDYFCEFCDLFLIDIEYLQILLKNCNFVIVEIITRMNNYNEIKSYRMSLQWNESVNFNQFLTNFNFLLEYNEIIKIQLVNFLGTLESPFLCDDIIWFIMKQDESDATELLMYMFSYGLKCSSMICDEVYQIYGYCQLFKFLLFLDIDINNDRDDLSSMAALIYDINLDLEVYLKKNIHWTADTSTVASADAVQLLDYFAHPELSDLLIKVASELNLSDRIKNKIENHPRMPLLVELSRNVFRKYFVQRLNIKSSPEFYSRVNNLQISNAYKKIIAYETKLY